MKHWIQYKHGVENPLSLIPNCTLIHSFYFLCVAEESNTSLQLQTFLAGSSKCRLQVPPHPCSLHCSSCVELYTWNSFELCAHGSNPTPTRSFSHLNDTLGMADIVCPVEFHIISL